MEVGALECHEAIAHSEGLLLLKYHNTGSTQETFFQQCMGTKKLISSCARKMEDLESEFLKPGLISGPLCY